MGIIGVMSGHPGKTRRQRLEAAKQRLRERPDDRRRWYWQVEVKVLRFILSAYGDGPDCPSRAADAAFHPELREQTGRPAGIRSRAEIRAILERIAATNETESRWRRFWHGLRHAFGGEVAGRAVT